MARGKTHSSNLARLLRRLASHDVDVNLILVVLQHHFLKIQDILHSPIKNLK